ncbi:OmpH family outer membrane protein [Shewanella sp. 202IG2-18]|uniref:OmpH family outer membrane protein n=1 Tax=Parashewanella hymeniacidonis TaxID=2807618 RepID=UPI0019605F6C|nr:OmpH family outer membrane protein [Parashewanella hymeniacidonis]
MTLALISAPLMAQAEKIAVVDMAAVFEQLPQREAVAKTLKSEFSDREAALKKKQDELRKLLEKSQRDAAIMSADQKTETQRQMESIRADLQLKGKALQEDFRKRSSEEQNKLLVKVQNAINALAKKEQFDLVLPRNAVVFVKPTSDISSKVIEALSKSK